MTVTTNKCTAWAILFAFIFSFISSPAQAQQLLSAAAQEDQNPAISPDASGNPDLQSHCGDGNCAAPAAFEDNNSSILTPSTSDTHVESVATLVQGLQSSLPPNYTITVNTTGARDKITIAYTGDLSKQPVGALSTLQVELNETAGGKLSLDLNSLLIEFKNKPLQAGDITILEDSMETLLETGLVGTPEMDEAAYAVAENPEDLYKVLAFSQVTISSSSTKGTGNNQAQTIVFIANSLTYTAARKINDFTSTLTPSVKSVATTMNSIIALQSELGDSYKVMVESRAGNTFKVSIKPRFPATEINQVSRVELSLNNGKITAKSLKIYVVSGQSGGNYLQTALADKAIEIMNAGALTLFNKNTLSAVAYLARSKAILTSLTGTNATSSVRYQNDGKIYKASYKGTAIIVEDVTDESEIRNFLFSSLQQKLGATFKVELLSISAQGIYDVKITGLGKIETKALSTITLKLEKQNGQIGIASNSLLATYKGVKATAAATDALFSSLGISIPGQSPTELSSITSLEDKLTTLTRIKILKAFDAEPKKVSFTYGDRDYRTSYDPGAIPFVEDHTDYRVLNPYIDSLKTHFSGTSISLAPVQGNRYAIQISDVSTKNGELMTISFDVTVSSGGIITPIDGSLKTSYKNLLGGETILGDAMETLKSGIAVLSGKTVFLDILKALRTTLVEAVSNFVFTVVFNKTRYDLKTENGLPVALHVFEVKDPVLSTLKALDPVLNPVLVNASAEIKATIATMKAELLKTGGNVLTNTDREGSVYIRFFSDADGTLTTIKIANNPIHNQKTIELTSLQKTTLLAEEVNLYLQNMATDAATKANAAEIKAMLVTYPIPTMTLSRTENGLSILTGVHKLSDPVKMVIYPDKTLRIYSASKSASAMPTLANGILNAKTALTTMEKYFGKVDMDTLIQLESVRAQITSGSVKFINVEKTADGSYQFTWFNGRDGSASGIVLAPTASGGKVFSALSLTTSSPLVGGQTKSLMSFIELYLKSYTALTAAQTKTHLDKLRGSTKKTLNPSSLITVTFSNGGVAFTKTPSAYTLRVSATGSVSLS